VKPVLVLLACLVLLPQVASARCFHFCRGQLDFGLGFGATVNQDSSTFFLHADVDYFVVDGLSLGLATRYTWDPRTMLPEAVLRFTPLVLWNISPYVVARAGRIFSFDRAMPDATTVSGGLGIAYFVTPFVSIVLEGLYQHVFDDAYDGGGDCFGGVRVFFG